MKRFLLYMGGIALLTTACSTKQVVTEPVTAQIVGSDISVTDEYTPRSWTEVFPDATLQSLIREALSANTDVKSAQLAMEQMEAQLHSAKLAYLPSFALSPSGTLSKIQDMSLTKTYELPVTMQWEIDLSGRISAQKALAQANLQQSQEQLKYVQIELIASIANTYYTLILLDEQARITQESVQNQEENLKVIQALKEVGRQNEVAVNQAEATYKQTQISLNELQLQREKTEHSLCLLLNRTPGKIERSTYTQVAGVQLNPDASISLQALSLRPDVKSAEYNLRAAFSNVQVARSAFYPSLNLTGSLGWTNNLGEVVNPGKWLLSAIGSLTQPLFQKGTLTANYKIAQAQQEQAQLAFEKALLTAGSEVTDALAECRSCQQKEKARLDEVEASKKAYENSQELMKYTSTTYLEVLVAQSCYLTAQLEATADWLEAIQGRISLYKALCGGAIE